MGSSGGVVPTNIISRVAAGRGDLIMTRPAIVGSIKENPGYKHILHVWPEGVPLVSDIEGLEIIPVSGIDQRSAMNGSLELASKSDVDNYYQLSTPALDYENSKAPWLYNKETKKLTKTGNVVDKSRQQIFCDILGVPFKIGNYSVSFSDNELCFAEGYLNGIGEHICLQLKTSLNIRNYDYADYLVDYIAKNYTGLVVIIDPDYEYDGKYKNVRILHHENIRYIWAIIAQARMFIGPDSVGVHMAGAVGVPTYGMFGSTDPKVRLIYDKVAWCDKYKRCDRQYCWYIACRRRPCINSRLPRYYWNDAKKKLFDGEIVSFVPIYNIKEIKDNIVIVRIRGIGDVLMTLPGIITLKEKRKNYKITYVTSKECAKILEQYSVIDNVIGVDYNHQSIGKPPVPLEIDVDEYDKVYNLINVVDFIPKAKSVSRMDLFGKSLGVNIDYNLDWKLKVPNEWLELALDKLRKYGVKQGNKILSMQITSAGQSRFWPVKRWKELSVLARKKGFRVVWLSDIIVLDDYKFVVNMTGRLTLEEYIGTIVLSKCFVGPDSSGIHIAGFTNTKAIGLFGSIDPGLRVAHYDTVYPIVGKRWCVPCNDWADHSCEDSEKHPICMWNIKPKTVMKKILEVV